MKFISLEYWPGLCGIPGNCRANELARRGATIELSDEFANLDIPMRTCKLIIDNAIIISVNYKWAASDTGRLALKIWPRLDERRTRGLLKFQRGALTVLGDVVTGHCIMSRHERLIGFGHLVNDFCKSCNDEERTLPHLLGTCPALWSGGTVKDWHWHRKSLHQELRMNSRLRDSG